MDSRDLLDFGTTTLKARLRNALERLTYRLATRLADGQTAITPRLAQLVGIPDCGNRFSRTANCAFPV